MLEKDIEKKLVRWAKEHGGVAYKFISPGNSGVPDRIVIFPNRPPIFVELKNEDGQLTKLQAKQITRLRALGQEAVVVKGAIGLMKFCEDAEKIYGI